MNDKQASDVDVEIHGPLQTFFVVNFVTDHITKLAFNCIYSKELDKKRGEFTAGDTLETLKGLVRSCHINTDQGELPTAPAETNSWQPSEEPVMYDCKISLCRRQMGTWRSRRLFTCQAA